MESDNQITRRVTRRVTRREFFSISAEATARGLTALTLFASGAAFTIHWWNGGFEKREHGLEPYKGGWLSEDPQEITIHHSYVVDRNRSLVEWVNLRTHPDLTGRYLTETIGGRIRVGTKLATIGQVRGRINIGINPYDRPSEVFFVVDTEELLRHKENITFYQDQLQSSYYINGFYTDLLGEKLPPI